jgi:hypothetical protein
MKRKPKLHTSKEFSAAVGRALRRAAKTARKTARMHGTPIYVWKNGKVVAEKPGIRFPNQLSFRCFGIPVTRQFPSELCLSLTF